MANQHHKAPEARRSHKAHTRRPLTNVIVASMTSVWWSFSQQVTVGAATRYCVPSGSGLQAKMSSDFPSVASHRMLPMKSEACRLGKKSLDPKNDFVDVPKHVMQQFPSRPKTQSGR